MLSDTEQGQRETLSNIGTICELLGVVLNANGQPLSFKDGRAYTTHRRGSDVTLLTELTQKLTTTGSAQESFVDYAQYTIRPRDQSHTLSVTQKPELMFTKDLAVLCIDADHEKIVFARKYPFCKEDEPYTLTVFYRAEEAKALK